MGLFDFARGIGNKIFGKDDDPADKIKEHIQGDNPGVENLEVVFEDGKVILKGDASSAEAMEKAVLMAGNAHGVETVDASAVTVPSPPSPDVVYYEIVKGWPTTLMMNRTNFMTLFPLLNS